MADQQDASLLERADSQSSVEVATNASRQSGPSDLKIAGFVMLACMLIAGQGLTAYFAISQRSQINDLEKTSDLLKIKMSQTPRGPPRTMKMPMYNAPLMTMELSNDDGKKKIPMKKLEDTVTVSLEKQVKDLLQDAQVPQFNQTFPANLQSLKSRMEDSDWKAFESWMHHWLLFQMAQQQPPEPTPTPMSASSLQTKCQLEAAERTRIGFYKPQCDEQGNYKPIQCWHSTGFCWCVDQNGAELPETMVRGKPICGGMAVSGRMAAMPSLNRLMADDSDQ